VSALLRTTVRAGLVGGLAVLAAAGTAAGAHARSGDMPYTCTGGALGGQSLTTTFTVRLDFPVPDDGLSTQRVGSTVVLHPMTGEVVLPEAVADLLRDQDITEVSGSGRLHAYIRDEVTDTFAPIDVVYPTTTVPASGPMTVPVRDDDASASTNTQPGENVLVSPFFSIGIDSASPDAGGITFECEPADDGDFAIDRLTGTTAPTATAEPSTTASAVRPGLVQTDAPDDEGTPALPAALLGAGALTAAALGRRLRRSGTIRRH
jgi:hypothetical protein